MYLPGQMENCEKNGGLCSGQMQTQNERQKRYNMSYLTEHWLSIGAGVFLLSMIFKNGNDCADAGFKPYRGSDSSSAYDRPPGGKYGP